MLQAGQTRAPELRYAITYLTNKIVDAEDRGLTLDEKLRIICPACQHPLTYVEPDRSARHFRHPSRSGPELIDPALQCEARVSQISEQAVRTHNRIVDQTNIQLFQRHFCQILVAAVNRKDNQEENIKWINLTKELISTKETASLLDNINNWCDEYCNNILAVDAELTESIQAELKIQNFKERCEFIRENLQNVEVDNDYCKAKLKLEIHCALEPANRILKAMIDWYDNGGDEKYPESILEEYWNLMSNMMSMLNHKKSTEMRNFAYAFSTQCIISRLILQGEKANWNDKSSINYLIARYMMSALLPASERERPLDEIVKDISSLLDKGIGLYDYLTSIGEMITVPEPEDWLDAIKRVDANDALKDYNGKGGFIYIAFNKIDDISVVSQVKIGKAKDIEKRRANYQTYSPDGFAFYNVYSVCDRHGAERYIQKKLKNHQIKGDGGQEWYKLSPDEADKKVSKYIHEYTKKMGFFSEKISTSQHRGFG